jgi:hypothetical protein
MLRVLWRKSQAFLKLSFSDQVLVPVTWLMLGIARATILVIPFRYFSGWLGQSAKTMTYTPVLDVAETTHARRIGHVVRATAKVTPWQSVCFPQALVACLLLRMAGIPYIMHFGLAKNPNDTGEDPMKAHAWVTAGPVAVTGGRRNLLKFTVVGSYLSPILYELQSLQS